MIKPNEGKIDRLVRVTVGVMLIALGYSTLTGTIQTVAYVVGIAGIVTGSLGFCGLYTLLGINTCPTKK